MTTDLPLVKRFQRHRWTPERQAIDAMTEGDILNFTEDQYFNVKSSVERLNEAYDGTRVWEMSAKEKKSVVRCVK